MIWEDFAGPGGWSQAIAQVAAGHQVVAVDNDPLACATAEAAGHARIVRDVRGVNVSPYVREVVGYAASPPCQPLSEANPGTVSPLQQLLVAVDLVARGEHPAEALARVHGPLDARAELSLWPLHRIRQLRPTWVALEQVRTVAPLWRAYATHLGRWGYRVAHGIVRAERHGVPQTRSRAVLLASRARQPYLPTPSRLAPTMRETLALPQDCGWRLRSNYGNNGVPGDRGMRGLDQPAPTITGKATRMWWVDEAGAKVRNLSYREAGQLQTFPADYPWQGRGNPRDQLIGNAVPPVLARALLLEVL